MISCICSFQQVSLFPPVLYNGWTGPYVFLVASETPFALYIVHRRIGLYRWPGQHITDFQFITNNALRNAVDVPINKNSRTLSPWLVHASICVQTKKLSGDVHLLKRPHESVHPSHWTLRDTMVKRFRRSV